MFEEWNWKNSYVSDTITLLKRSYSLLRVARNIWSWQFKVMRIIEGKALFLQIWWKSMVLLAPTKLIKIFWYSKSCLSIYLTPFIFQLNLSHKFIWNFELKEEVEVFMWFIWIAEGEKKANDYDDHFVFNRMRDKWRKLPQVQKIPWIEIISETHNLTFQEISLILNKMLRIISGSVANLSGWFHFYRMCQQSSRMCRQSSKKCR